MIPKGAVDSGITFDWHNTYIILEQLSHPLNSDYRIIIVERVIEKWIFRIAITLLYVWNYSEFLFLRRQNFNTMGLGRRVTARVGKHQRRRRENYRIARDRNQIMVSFKRHDVSKSRVEFIKEMRN